LELELAKFGNWYKTINAYRATELSY